MESEILFFNLFHLIFINTFAYYYIVLSFISLIIVYNNLDNESVVNINNYFSDNSILFLMMITILNLAGIPPFSIFFVKFINFFFLAGVVGFPFLVFFFLLTCAISLFYLSNLKNLLCYQRSRKKFFKRNYSFLPSYLVFFLLIIFFLNVFYVFFLNDVVLFINLVIF